MSSFRKRVDGLNRWIKILIALLVVMILVCLCTLLNQPVRALLFPPPTGTVAATQPGRPTGPATLTPTPTGPLTDGSLCPQEAIDAIAGLRAGYELPDYLQQQDAEKRGGEFDVGSYFTVLKHLNMEPGYVLDYVYYWDGMGGSPVLYARKVEAPAYRTYSEYERAVGTPAPGAGTGSWLDRVQTDDTPEGFLELVGLRVMANQFYLYWHSGYNDARIVCNRAMVDAIVSSLEGGSFGQAMIPEQAAAARALDTTPRVELGDRQVVVEIVMFTRWGGFYRATFTLQRDFPHRFEKPGSQVLVPYDCGIMF
jgi:hypothetical protein